MSKKEFDEFCEMYQDIKLPFWMQTRPETINDYNIKKLSEVGLHRISFGIEHGNQEYRKNILKRSTSNERMLSAFKMTSGKKYITNGNCITKLYEFL